jgi:hypothetical protein
MTQHAPQPLPLTLKNPFVRNVAAGLGLLLAIHVVAPLAAARGSGFRWLCTLVYFGTLLFLCRQMLRPRAEYFKALYAWKFEDCPQTIDRAWRRYLYSQDLLITGFVYLAMAFLASTTLSVLSHWHRALAPLWLPNGVVWCLSLAGMLLYPTSPLMTELLQRRRFLYEELEHMEIRPRSLADLAGGGAPPGEMPAADRPVVVRGPQEFSAGGVDWRWADFLPNCVVFGQAGSGKTVCVLNALLDGVLTSNAQCQEKASALILDPKGDFRGKIEKICRRLGREDDLLVLDPARPGRSIRWNPLDAPDDELELAGRFVAVLETLDGRAGDDPFWTNQAKQFLRHAVALLRLAYPDRPPSLPQVGELAPKDSAALKECVGRLDLADPRCETCLNFFARQWVAMPDEQHAGVVGHITNMVDPFTMPPYATLLAGKSTWTVRDVVRGGKILYVDMPMAEKEVMTRTVGTFLKLAYYREVLRVLNKRRPSFFFCDEFQAFFTPGKGGDADFFERSRQSYHANFIATQNIPALLKHAPREEPVLNLLGNCAVKIFLRNTDEKTNEYASKLWGERLAGMAGSSATPGGGFLGGLTPGAHASTNDTPVRVVRPEEFGMLDIPVREDPGRQHASALVRLGSRAEVERQALRRRWHVHALEG